MVHFSNSWGKKFFLENPALSRTTSNRFLAPCQNLEKINDVIPRIFYFIGLFWLLLGVQNAKYDDFKLIATKKDDFLKEKISGSIGKPQELWEFLKYLGMPNKTLISNFNAMEGNDNSAYDI